MIDNLKNQLEKWIDNRSILILGFGKEGRSTYSFLRQFFPNLELTIADQNTEIEKEFNSDKNLKYILGENFLSKISDFKLVFKTPGISFKSYDIPTNQHITSQTDLFLKLFSEKCIGITGSKGKSTTSSLIYHVLSKCMENVFLIGNIGIPPLSIIDKIDENSWFVIELSSHQLEFVSHSPHISILLNLYEEHLDHYLSYKDYRNSKWNIAKYQKQEYIFIYNSDEEMIMQDIDNYDIISKKLKYGFASEADISISKNQEIIFGKNNLLELNVNNFKLLGIHNQLNLLAALLVFNEMEIPLNQAFEVACQFKSLPHRMEFVATLNEVKFYNDSISTIPQATIKALESIPNVSTLILGGFDRGISYEPIIKFLLKHKPLTILLLGSVGEQIQTLLEKEKYKGKLIFLKSFNNTIEEALKYTKPGEACLLSPAASSYDSFKNFEERGDCFKKLINDYSM